MARKHIAEGKTFGFSIGSSKVEILAKDHYKQILHESESGWAGYLWRTLINNADMELVDKGIMVAAARGYDFIWTWLQGVEETTLEVQDTHKAPVCDPYIITTVEEVNRTSPLIEGLKLDDTQLKELQPERKLGSGQFGEVWQGTYCGKSVAMKFLQVRLFDIIIYRKLLMP
jgi:hypothetical protein